MNEQITVVCSAWHKQKNLELYFRQHLDSLLNQTIPVKIIYICDGGLVLDARDPRVTMVTVSDGIRTAEAFNLGLALTNTPYFAVLNLDDFYFRNALELQVGAMKQLDADAFFGDWEIRFTREGETDRMCLGLEELKPCTSWPPENVPGLRLGNGDGHRGTWGPAPIFRTAALRELGGYPKWFGDGSPVPTIIDWIVWQRFLKAEKQVSRGAIVVGSYYSNPPSQQEFRSGNNTVIAEHQRYEHFGAMV
jgi:hypothetical protein